MTDDEQVPELDSGPTCGPHDFEVVPAVTGDRVKQLYCRGCGGVLEIAKADHVEAARLHACRIAYDSVAARERELGRELRHVSRAYHSEAGHPRPWEECVNCRFQRDLLAGMYDGERLAVEHQDDVAGSPGLKLNLSERSDGSE